MSLLKARINRIDAFHSFKSLLQQGIEFLQAQYREGRFMALNGEDSGAVVERMKSVLTDVTIFESTALPGGKASVLDEIYSTYSTDDPAS
jgi:hypothetical protein